jgi:CRP/FNR family transcriptional regulator, cyclic AMP receptor protein
MSVRIRLARSTEDLDQVFQLRQRVMVDEKRWMPAHNEGRLCDRFDAYPTTANVIAVADDSVIGAVRFMMRTSVGASTDEFFDFANYVGERTHEAAGGMLVLAPGHRGTHRLASSMIWMGYVWALQQGASHIVAVANPRVGEAFLRDGWQTVAPVFRDADTGLDVMPLVLMLNSLNDRASSFVRRQQFEHCLDAFERQFHVEGETIIRDGDSAREAFVIVHGNATVMDAVGQPIRQLGPGDLFGELALLTRRPRTATVVADSELDLMVLDRAAFHRQLRSNPEVMEDVLAALAERLATARML